VVIENGQASAVPVVAAPPPVPTATPAPPPTATPRAIAVDGSPEDWVGIKDIRIQDQEGDLTQLVGVSNSQAAKWIDFKSVRVTEQNGYLYILLELFGDVRPDDSETRTVAYNVSLRGLPKFESLPQLGCYYVITKGIDWYVYDGTTRHLDSQHVKAAYKNNFVELGLPLEEIRAWFPGPAYMNYMSARNVNEPDTGQRGDRLISSYRIGDWSPDAYTQVLW